MSTRGDPGAWEAPDEAGKRYTEYSCDGASYGLHGGTTPRYDKAVAEFAWQRRIESFRENLV